MKSARTSSRHKNIITLVLLIVTGVVSGVSLFVASVAPLRQSAPSGSANQSDSTPLSAPSTPAVTERAREAYGRIEMSFEANRGRPIRRSTSSRAARAIRSS